MREHLRQRNGLRGRFTATFERFGSRYVGAGYHKRTILLIAVHDERGTLVTDHVWMDAGRQVTQLALQRGDRLAFEARVKEYWKGCKAHHRYLEEGAAPPTKDYRLSHPTMMRKLHAQESSTTKLPLFESSQKEGDGEWQDNASASGAGKP